MPEQRDPWAWWRAWCDGVKLPLHEDEPVCGYFRMRDRRGDNLYLASNKRPVIAAAIWQGEGGEFLAEMAGDPVPLDLVWPWAAKWPVTYEHYQYWHEHQQFPEGMKYGDRN